MYFPTANTAVAAKPERVELGYAAPGLAAAAPSVTLSRWDIFLGVEDEGCMGRVRTGQRERDKGCLSCYFSSICHFTNVWYSTKWV